MFCNTSIVTFSVLRLFFSFFTVLLPDEIVVIINKSSELIEYSAFGSSGNSLLYTTQYFEF